MKFLILVQVLTWRLRSHTYHVFEHAVDTVTTQLHLEPSQTSYHTPLFFVCLYKKKKNTNYLKQSFVTRWRRKVSWAIVVAFVVCFPAPTRSTREPLCSLYSPLSALRRPSNHLLPTSSSAITSPLPSRISNSFSYWSSEDKSQRHRLHRERRGHWIWWLQAHAP